MSSVLSSPHDVPTLTSAPPSHAPVLPWRRAATLAERAGGRPSEVDGEQADRRMAQWGRLPALAAVAGEGVLARDAVLAPLGVSGEQLRSLLGETDGSLRQRLEREPTWYRRYLRCWEAGTARPTLPPDAKLELVEFARPLIDGAIDELRQRGDAVVAAVGEGVDRRAGDAALAALLAHPPLEDLAMTAGPTMVLELNVARVEGELTAGDTKARYQQFVDSLRDPARAAEIMREYPVLVRALVTRLGFWVDRSIEFLQRLCADLPELRATLLADESVLHPTDPVAEPIEVGIAFDAGDSHRRGRSVAILRIGGTRLVYKPRDPAVDVAFDGLLAWFNATSPAHHLRRTALLARDGYAWYEFIDTDVATDEGGVARYVHRLGALTALLHALHATDMHFENVLAAGEDPVLIDLEALLHVDKGGADTEDGDLVNPAARALGDSVLSVGVLPNRVLSGQGPDAVAVDVSAVGGHGGQEGLVSVPTFVEAGTDTMHIRAERSEVPDQRNVPTGDDGGAVRLLDHHDAFRAGFREAYATISEQREVLSEAGGLLDAFTGATVRHIARPTFLYGRLLLQSMHPDFMRDALDRSMCLGKMLGGHAGKPARTDMIAAEYADMLDGDIPVFAVEVDGGTLLAGSDERPIATLELAPLEAVRRRIDGFAPADLAFQTQIVDLAFAAASIDGAVDAWPGWVGPRPDEPVDPQRFHDHARRLGRDLLERSFREDGRTGWIGLDLVDDRWWTVRPAATDLYGGVPGIAHALATVGDVTDDQVLSDAARGALHQVADSVGAVADAIASGEDPDKLASVGCGVFGYVGGSMYALAHGAARYGDRALLDAARRLLAPLRHLASLDRQHDVVAGRAGAILSLLSLYAVRPDDEVLAAATACADDLVAAATVPDDHQRCWVSAADGQALVGLSHGAVGIAYALDRLDRVRGTDDHRSVVHDALAYERRHLRASTGDWKDLRADAAENPFGMRAWCHGAPGAALVRRALLDGPRRHDLGEALREERDLSLQAVRDTGLGADTRVSGIGNDSLCHGDVGNLLCLERAVEPGSPPDPSVETTWQAVLDHAERDGWACGVPRGHATPGLMTGLAGIAWGLASRAGGDEVPDLLLLEAPRPAAEVR